MKPLLTIAVPTFNRVDKLEKCLNIILNEIQGRPVELLVSDNASTDGTEDFMKRFSQENPAVTYIRNSENIGPDRNFMNCYEKAAADYAVLIGDDDVLLPGVIDKILEAVSAKPVFIHLNSSTLLNWDTMEHTPANAPEIGTVVYDDRSDFLTDIGIFITFVSSLVMRTDLVRQIPDKDRYIGSYLLQSHLALRTLAQEGKYIRVTDNCIAATGNERVNYDVYYVWGQQYSRLLLETGVQIGLSEETARKIHKHDLENTILYFVSTLPATCAGSKKWKKSCIMNAVKAYPKLCLKYAAYVYLPSPIIKVLRKLF